MPGVKLLRNSIKNTELKALLYSIIILAGCGCIRSNSSVEIVPDGKFILKRIGNVTELTIKNKISGSEIAIDDIGVIRNIVLCLNSEVVKPHGEVFKYNTLVFKHGNEVIDSIWLDRTFFTWGIYTDSFEMGRYDAILSDLIKAYSLD